jgi:hypothetical protein
MPDAPVLAAHVGVNVGPNLTYVGWLAAAAEGMDLLVLARDGDRAHLGPLGAGRAVRGRPRAVRRASRLARRSTVDGPLSRHRPGTD